MNFREARGGSIKKNRLRRADVVGRPAGRPVKRFVRRPARLMGSERYVALPGGWRMWCKKKSPAAHRCDTDVILM